MKTTATTATATDGPAARLALTRNEALICTRLPSARSQSNFRAGRLAAKRAVADVVGCRSSRRIEVCSRADGSPRPSLLDRRGRGRETRIQLSISHRDGRAAAAAAPAGVRVGIDLERATAVPLHLAAYFLTRSERALATACDPTLLWSFKEAAWKALGLGGSVPFKALELRCGDAGELLGVRVRGELLPMHARTGTPWPGYHVVVVWTTGGAA
jgi:4'-phosphopantetheinyl transferase EntD